MDKNTERHFKVYLFDEDTGEYEIRRFNVGLPTLNTYNFLVEKIRSIFPGLSDKVFTLYWRDEEQDDVAISSDHELYFLMTLPCKVTKLFVRIQPPSLRSKQGEIGDMHLGVYCDKCDQVICGIRYKCGVCNDYDLCSPCRQSGIHDDHPMYRIPHPLYIDPAVGVEVFHGKYKSRRHLDSGKKKRRCEKRESVPEAEDESEEMHHGKYHHKKWKKGYKCPYSQMVNDFVGYFSPIHFQPRQSESQNHTNNISGTEVPSHVSCLKNLGSALHKILDPLGVSVEFEVRPKENLKEEKKNEKGKEKEATETESSASPEKEVRFGGNEQLPEAMMQKIEEITKILSNQTMSNGADNDNGWVSFEELKKDTEEPKPGSSSEVPKPSQPQASPPKEEKPKEIPVNQNLYPDLTARVPSNPTVAAALESMLGMGFTNEGNWLASLLEAKNGDISRTLEALSSRKK